MNIVLRAENHDEVLACLKRMDLAPYSLSQHLSALTLYYKDDKLYRELVSWQAAAFVCGLIMDIGVVER